MRDDSEDTQSLPIPRFGGRQITSAPGFPAPANAGSARRRRARQIARSARRWITAAVYFAFAGIFLLSVSLIAAIYWQARTDETRSVEAIVVLGAAQFNGRPSPVLRARLDRALEVYNDGYAPIIVVSGGRVSGDQFTEAEAGRDYLVERGVPEEAILLEDAGSDSWESMRGVAALLEPRNVDRVLLVSNGFHLLRVEIMARDLGLTAFSTASTSGPIRPWSAPEFSYVIREAAGIVAYLAGYR